MPWWRPGGPGNAATVGQLLTEADALYQQTFDLPQRGLLPMAERLRRDVDQAMAVVEQAYPTVVATVRWPSRFRVPS